MAIYINESGTIINDCEQRIVFCDGVKIENVGSFCDDPENGWVDYLRIDKDGYAGDNGEFNIRRRFGKITWEFA